MKICLKIKYWRGFTTLLLVALFFHSTSLAQSAKKPSKKEFINYKAIKKFPRPIEFVYDFEHILTGKQKQQLDSIIIEFEANTTNEIKIVTIADFSPYESLQDFTTDLGNYWGVGRSGADNGLVMTISRNKREIWVGTGLGTEKVLTDEILKEIIDQEILPYFKAEEYFKGIKSGLLECIERWNDTP